MKSSLSWLTIVALVFSIVQPFAFLLTPLPAQAIVAVPFFKDTFSRTASATVGNGWVEQNNDPNNEAISTGCNGTISPGSISGPNYLKLASTNQHDGIDSRVTRDVSTSSYNTVTLSYQLAAYHTESSGKNADHLYVEWSGDNGVSWNSIETVALDGGNNCDQVGFQSRGPIVLNGANNLSQIKLRFSADFTSDDESYFIDDVILTGVPFSGAIAGQKWNDVNGNGVKDDEAGLPNWMINLYKNGQLARSTTTDQSGNYRFSGLVDGDYKVCEAMPAGLPPWVETYPVATTTLAVACTGQNEGPAGWPVTVAGGEVGSQNFGNRQQALITIHKTTVPTSSSQTFIFSGSGTAGLSQEALTLGDGGEFQNILPAGAYAVSETSVAGWDLSDLSCDGAVQTDLASSTASFNLVAGQTLNCTFTNTQRGSISLTKIADPDSGQFTFTLSGPSTTTPIITNGSGSGSWADLLAGSYTLTETVPDGWTGAKSASCSVGSGESFDPTQGAFTLDPGAQIHCTFNNSEFGVITGRKFEDSNADGQLNDGEQGLAGWQISLLQQVDQQWATTSTKTTNQDGTYTFDHLLSSTTTSPYLVCETPQDGWHQSAGFGNAQCPDGSAGYLINLDAGQLVQNQNFGNWRPGSITGLKWNDENGNGLKDDNETGLPGWQIYLDKNTNGVYDQNTDVLTTTDGTGHYSFSDLPPGIYQVREIPQTGWAQVYPAADAPQTVTLLSGGSGNNIDFGNWQRAVVAGYKWSDNNQNGIFDQGEPGIADWTIDATKGDLSKTATTSGNGYYQFFFTPTETGTWTISEASRPGWIQTHPVDPNAYQVEVTTGTNLTAENFGNWQAPIVIDTTAPTTTITSPTASSTWQDVILVSGTTTDDVAVASTSFAYALYSGETCGAYNPITTLDNASTSPVFDWTYNWSPAAEGIYCIEANGIDTAGNVEHTAVVYPIKFTKTQSGSSSSSSSSGGGGGGGVGGHHHDISDLLSSGSGSSSSSSSGGPLFTLNVPPAGIVGASSGLGGGGTTTGELGAITTSTSTGLLAAVGAATGTSGLLAAIGSLTGSWWLWLLILLLILLSPWLLVVARGSRRYH